MPNDWGEGQWEREREGAGEWILFGVESIANGEKICKRFDAQTVSEKVTWFLKEYIFEFLHNPISFTIYH